jgi:hypothetical protein
VSGGDTARRTAADLMTREVVTLAEDASIG